MRRPTRDELEALSTLAERAVLAESGATPFRQGAEYVEAGAVRSLRYSGGVLTARVRGTRRHRVTVALDEDLRCTCDCALGEEGACCKHCVAVLLAWLDELRGA